MQLFKKPWPVTGSSSLIKSMSCIKQCVIISLFAGGLASCAVGPDYTRATLAAPESFKEAPAGWKVAQPADQLERGAWWRIFNDPQLNTLADKIEISNQTVAAYAAAYQHARALARQARAAFLPQVSAAAEATRARTAARAVNGSNALRTTYGLTLDASWEPDLWGTLQRTERAETAQAQSAAAELENARLSAQATLVQNYFQLRTLDATQQLLDDTVQAYQQALKLTQNRYAQGVAARADVLQAQTALQAAQAAALNNGIARAQYEHAIAVLVGEPASTFSLSAAPLKLAAPPRIPFMLPSALLERRPDIASAERRAAAANEKIGVTMAAFFPSLKLLATGGYQSSAFLDWLSAPARVWSLGPQLAAVLFDGGARQAQTAAARASFEQDTAHYRQTVLNAFQEVEDALAALRILEQEAVLQQQAVQSAQHALKIVLNQYTAGMTMYLSVISVQATAFAVEQKMVGINGQRMVATAGLIKALGGGWDESQMQAPSQE